MASLGFSFNVEDVPVEQRDFSPLPAGEYVIQIIESEMRATNDGNGQYLKLVHEVIEGPFSGRKLWNNLNLVNANDQTREIAQRTLASICYSIGKTNVSDSEELHFQPMLAYVKMIPAGTVKGRKTYEKDSNEIGSYKPMSAPTAPARPVTAPMQHAPRTVAPAAAARVQAAPIATPAPAGAKPLPWAAARR